MNVTVKSLTVGRWKENSYLLEYNGEAWLVDPGDEFEKLDNHFLSAGTVYKGIINTHGHFDHIGAVKHFREKYNIPFYIHSKDKQLVRQANLYVKLSGGIPSLEIPAMDHFLDDLPSVDISDKSIRIHHTPGHTHGSVSFEIDNILITGDILFSHSLGGADRPAGNKSVLKDSINYVLDNFQGYTIYPGHGEAFLLDEMKVESFKKMLG